MISTISQFSMGTRALVRYPRLFPLTKRCPLTTALPLIARVSLMTKRQQRTMALDSLKWISKSLPRKHSRGSKLRREASNKKTNASTSRNLQSHIRTKSNSKAARLPSTAIKKKYNTLNFKEAMTTWSTYKTNKRKPQPKSNRETVRTLLYLFQPKKHLTT